MIQIHSKKIVENEHLYGPGKRLLLFLQGCSIHCEGCINRHLWPFEGGVEYTSAELIKEVLENNLEGITIHGGEPLDQAAGLFELIVSVKSIGRTVILFTGYTKKQLDRKHLKAWNASDIVVAGPFVMAKRNVYLQFRGSTNQRVYSHKGPYRGYKVKDGATSAMLTIGEDGQMEINGFFTEDVVRLVGADT